MKKILLLSFLSIVLIACASKQSQTSSDAKAQTVAQKINHDGLETAILAGGCFWCTEAIFERVIGVKDVISGYTGGPEKNPTYKQVSYGETGHTECVIVHYNPKELSFEKILEVFFATIDPTQVNGQGPDRGRQYRTGVFYQTESQKAATEAYVEKLSKSGKYSKPIATEITKLEKFYPAENYHQNYYEDFSNPNQGYVQGVTRPKVEKYKKLFPELVKEQYK